MLLNTTPAHAAERPRALITGASSGIGLATALQLVRDGFHVVGVARNAERLAAAADEMRGPGTFVAHPGDAAQQAVLRAAVAAQPLDLVVASAGVCAQARLLDPHATEVWRQSMRINLDAVFYALQATLPHLRRGGSFIAISSGLGKNARAAYSAYCASKHAVLGLVKSAALEVAPDGIRVNAICPGWVETPMSAGDIEVTAERRGMDAAQLRTEIVAGLPLGRPVAPEEVAALCVWLGSGAASAITGQAYNISCGEFSL